MVHQDQRILPTRRRVLELSFLISHFSFLISHFSFLISHFSFLISIISLLALHSKYYVTTLVTLDTLDTLDTPLSAIPTRHITVHSYKLSMWSNDLLYRRRILD
ncbi:hypothetical protein K504DRAFT_22458 [Pleomassaria siparia CBS 279.74]|uniref:Uncharacterized protein n=1 Tax=Pleomassaria siparia CBS 279.74 TaxID=1314801 RepID=A0A6G1KSC6_9PLEO|nr:hypothetical protein K504DRAFT_22458 [Pleomassaria siparia CBS 279.74]